MSTTAIICTAFALVLFGLWLGFYLNRDIRKEAREAAERAAAAKRREEAEGRAINERAVLKKEVLCVLSEIVSDPDRLRRHQCDRQYGRSFNGLHEFLVAHQRMREYADRIVHFERGQRDAGIERRLILENQKDIQKALGMGQPVEQ